MPDWNRWLGAAPLRLYDSAYVPFKRRDFGGGALGDTEATCRRYAPMMREYWS